MDEDLERLKQRIPLLGYLQRHNWKPCRAGASQELVGLCPLHHETRPSFYVNPAKNLFYCHGCGRGGDLIRFVQLFLDLSFRQTLAHIEQELTPAPAPRLLKETAAFYQLQLHRHPEATRYLDHRGLHDPTLIEELGIGYAPGGNLRSHLAALGYSFDLLLNTGLLNGHGRDAFCRRVIFPCREHGQVVNLYGRAIGAAFPHRLLPRSKGALFAWESVRTFPTVILVEGLFDLAVLWQAGFGNTTCAIGTQLTSAQLTQLADQPGRTVYIVFDEIAWANDFLDAQHLRQLSPRSLRPYAYDLLHFTRWFQSQSQALSEITESTLLDYVRHQLSQQPQPTPQTVNHRLTVIRCLYVRVRLTPLFRHEGGLHS